MKSTPIPTYNEKIEINGQRFTAQQQPGKCTAKK
jgi:hypothetical protein